MPDDAEQPEEPAPERPPERPSTPADDRDEDLVPRPSKMRYLALFLAGMFIGRLASENFAPGTLDALDLLMYIGLALSIAWAWRSWARQAMIRRHLDTQRRQERAARASSGAGTADGPGTSGSSGGANASAPRPRRRRRR